MAKKIDSKKLFNYDINRIRNEENANEKLV